MNGIVAFAVMLANGAGQFAIIAILLGTLRRHRASPGLRALLAGSLFALFALVTMSQPAEVAPGAFLDLRGIVLGLAGAFSGWPATAVAAIVAAIYRVSLGGHYLQGCASILIAAGTGYGWSRFVRGSAKTRTRPLLGLGLLLPLHALPILTVPGALRPEIVVPWLVTVLVASLLGALTLGKLIGREERMIAQETRLAAEAYHDPLTHLLNRRGFEQAYFGARAHEGGDTVAVLLLDVDFFKTVNDTHGHDVGDLVLRSIAETLRNRLPAGASASRHGGEEFAVLLIGFDHPETVEVAETLRRAVADTPVPIGADRRIGVTASLGVALCQDGRTALQDLLVLADRALYRAKREGRNRVQFQDAEPVSETAPRLRLASAR